MKRRDFLKLVGITVVAPSLPLPVKNIEPTNIEIKAWFIQTKFDMLICHTWEEWEKLHKEFYNICKRHGFFALDCSKYKNELRIDRRRKIIFTNFSWSRHERYD
jgi:hypothetical protein